ncbi:MAG: hypothetical protein IJX10_08165 [Phascolarctobacterium sp.]|nr:hypothetical protein [Phascolarctobacterium sp.]
MVRVIKGVNEFETFNPDLAKEWHPTANGILKPSDIASRSNKKYFWLCKKGHTYDASSDKRVRGSGCPFCANKRILVGYNDLKSKFPDLIEEWDYENNDDNPENYVYSSSKKVNWVCKRCGHRWKTSICHRTGNRKSGCPECAKKIRGELKHRYALEHSGSITDQLLLKEWDYTKNEKGPEEYTPSCNLKVFWKCSICGYEYVAKISNRTNGKGCACCANLVVVKGVNDLATTHPKLASEWHPTKNGDLTPEKVTYGKGKKVWWICSEGHEYLATILHRSHGTNCPICNSGRQTSFAEQAVYFYIKKLFSDTISRYTGIFDNGMELDIYIPSIKLAIEYDGEAWHKSEKVEREKEKYRICRENGIKLLRLKEKRSDTDIHTADDVWNITGNGPMYERKNLALLIRLLLDRLDPRSNFWTRKRISDLHSPIDVDIDRDEMEIRAYMTKLNNNSLEELFPKIAKEWHPTKNKSVKPNQVKKGSTAKYWWLCSVCNNEYMASVYHRTSGTGCPKCGAKRGAANRRRKVYMIDMNTNEILKTFESIVDAAQYMNFRTSSNITSVCKGKRMHAGGYLWRYEGEAFIINQNCGKEKGETCVLQELWEDNS